MLTQLFSYWSSITLPDLLTGAYLVLLVLFVTVCHYLFTNFVDSKPEGRKTVLGCFVKKLNHIYKDGREGNVVKHNGGRDDD